MNAKNFVIAGLAGGVVDFLLGWLFYGELFKDYYPAEEMPNMLFIILGCLMFGILASYVFVYWANLMKFKSGLISGAVFGLLLGLMTNFFMRAGSLEVDYEHFGIDLLIGIIMGAIVVAVVAAVNGAMRPKTA